MDIGLAQVADALPGLVWTALPDGRADYLNQRWWEYTGVATDQGLGDAWQDAVHPEDRPGHMAAWRSIVESGVPGEMEVRLRRRDGAYRLFLISASPVLDDAGRLLKWCGTGADIEDRRRAEEERVRDLLKHREVEESFRAIVETTPECVKLVSPEGIVLQVNHAGVAMAGVDCAGVVVGQCFYDFVAPEHRELYRAFNERICAGGKGFLEFDLINAKGVRRHMETHAAALHASDGRLVQLGVTRDITPQKEAEDQLRRSEEMLDRLRSELAHVTRVNSLGALTASIAHEVNQPLAGIMTNAGTCVRMLSADPPNVQGALETAKRTIRDGTRASEVITRLRALFSKKVTITDALDLNEAAREVVALVGGELRRHGVSVRLALADDLRQIRGDRVQLQQVVLNLVMNAVDAMSVVDDRARELTLGTRRTDEDGVQLMVTDTGPGFEPRVADKLFDAFFTTKTHGMGIGLSVSRSIIESHGGRLWAMPNQGPGATFAFAIPPQVSRVGVDAQLPRAAGSAR